MSKQSPFSEVQSSVTIPEAVYTASLLPEHGDNPFIEALQPISDEDAWVRSLEERPHFDPAERKLPDHLRPYCVLRLRHLYVLLPQHLDLAYRLDQVIREGYVGRNPRDRGRAAALQKAYALGQSGGESPRFSENQPIASLSVMGFSGVGKSTTVERIVGAFPQVLYHPETGLYQVVWVKLDCPPDGSIKQLILALLAELDRLLGTDFRNYVSGRVTVDELLGQVRHYAVAYNLGLLVIDEIQNLSVKHSGGRETMLNVFQQLCNTLSVPVLLVGTMKARSVLGLDFRHARRNAAVGSFTWGPLKPGQTWDYLVESFWDYQWVRNPVPLTPSMVEFLHDQTQGVIAIFSGAYMLAQMRAIRTGTETLTEDLLRHVLEHDLAPVQPMLKALRSGDSRRIRHYEDIWPLDLTERLESEQRKLMMGKPRKGARRNASETPMEAQAVTHLEAMGFDVALAEAAVGEAAATGKAKTVAALTRLALERLTPLSDDDEALGAPDPADLRQWDPETPARRPGGKANGGVAPPEEGQ